MKSFRRSVYGRKGQSRKRKQFSERMAHLRENKERKRHQCAAAEPPRSEWRGRLEHTWTFHNRLTGELHALDIRRGQRRDRYDLVVDGRPWRAGVSATALAALLRRKLAAHISE